MAISRRENDVTEAVRPAGSSLREFAFDGVPDTASLRRAMVENPAKLYDL